MCGALNLGNTKSVAMAVHGKLNRKAATTWWAPGLMQCMGTQVLNCRCIPLSSKPPHNDDAAGAACPCARASMRAAVHVVVSASGHNMLEGQPAGGLGQFVLSVLGELLPAKHTVPTVHTTARVRGAVAGLAPRDGAGATGATSKAMR